MTNKDLVTGALIVVTIDCRRFEVTAREMLDDWADRQRRPRRQAARRGLIVAMSLSGDQDSTAAAFIANQRLDGHP